MNPAPDTILYTHQPGLLALAAALSRRLEPCQNIAVGEGRVIRDANQIALYSGVHVGLPINRARRLCPLLLVVPMEELDQRLVSQLSHRLWNALASLSPTIQPAGPTAAFATLLPGEQPLFHERLTPLFPELPKSHIGTGSSKLIAHALAESGVATLASAPVSPLLWPQDLKVVDKLLRLGLSTFGEVAAIGEEALIYQFGRKIGAILYRRAQGIDADPVCSLWPLATITTRKEFGFEPLEDRGAVEHWVGKLTQQATTELRDMGRFARRMELMLHTERGRRQKAVLPPLPLQDEREIHRAALRLLSLCKPDAPITCLTLILSELELPAARSLSLFDEVSEKSKLQLEGVKRRLKERYGPKAITVVGALPVSHLDQRREASRGVWTF